MPALSLELIPHPEEEPKPQGEKKDVASPQAAGGRVLNAAESVLAKFESKTSDAKTRLQEEMNGMNPEQRLQYVKNRLNTFQNSLKRVTGEGRAARKAEQAPEKAALLGYVEARLNILAEDLKRAMGEGRIQRSSEQEPERVQLEQLRTSLQP